MSSVVLFTTLAGAQDPIDLPRISGPIKIDGVLDEASWDELSPLPLVMYEPVYQGPMTEHTEIRIGYDSDYIYASAILHYSDLSIIRANSLTRDRYSGDDTFSIFLDTFNDREHGLWFSVNPNGIRLDYSISSDLEYGGGDPFDRVINESWNAFWDAATTRTDEGWIAEIRIPFSSLGFQDNNGVVEMGLSTSRSISSKAEIQVFPPTPPDWGMGYAKPSQYARIRLVDTVPSPPIYITPFVSGGLSRLHELNDLVDDYQRSSGNTIDIGGDVKYSLNSNLTLDITVNTDFAQVEADDQQVNLSRFALFFPEKRRFFQERAGIFEFRTFGRFGRLFHSRRIGLHQGEAVPIIGGARMVGRLGGWDVGFLNIQTAATDDLAAENFGVYRIRRNLNIPNSFVGAMVTSRIGWDHTYNYVYGFDSQIRVAPKNFLEVKWAQVLSNDTNLNPVKDFSGGYSRARLERRTQIGLTYTASFTWQGENFEPGVGFLDRTGLINPFFILGYRWLANEQSSILSYGGRILTSHHFRDSDRSLEWGLFRFELPLFFKNGDEHALIIEAFTDDINEEPLELPGNTIVPVGRYRYVTGEWEYQMSDGRLLRADVTVSGGKFYDGTNVGFEIEPTWNTSRYLELGAAYSFNRVQFPDRDEAFNVHIGRLRAQASFTPKISLSAFLQYNASMDIFLVNSRFRFNFKEGNDLWIVFNESRNTDRHGLIPIAPSLDNRTILLKYTYTFIQ